MLKNVTLLFIMTSALAATLLALDVASSAPVDGCVLKEETLAEARGGSPGWTWIESTEYCPCVYAPGLLACVCNAGNNGTECVVCEGQWNFCAQYGSMGSGWQPSGGDAYCSSLEAYAGTCVGGAICSNPIDCGPCKGSYPNALPQSIGVRDESGARRIVAGPKSLGPGGSFGATVRHAASGGGRAGSPLARPVSHAESTARLLPARS
jgi:hypothetical protein